MPEHKPLTAECDMVFTKNVYNKQDTKENVQQQRMTGGTLVPQHKKNKNKNKCKCKKQVNHNSTINSEFSACPEDQLKPFKFLKISNF